MILYYCQSLQIQTHLETHNGTQKKQHHESEDLSLRSCEWIFSTCSVAAEAGTFGGFWVFANSFAIIAPPCTQKMQTFESSARSEKRLPASKFYTSSKLCMVWFTQKTHDLAMRMAFWWVEIITLPVTYVSIICLPHEKIILQTQSSA